MKNTSNYLLDNVYTIDKINEFLGFSLVNTSHNVHSGPVSFCSPVRLRRHWSILLPGMGKCSNSVNAVFLPIPYFCFDFKHSLLFHSYGLSLESLRFYCFNYLTSAFLKFFLPYMTLNYVFFFSSKPGIYINKTNPRSCSCDSSNVGGGLKAVGLLGYWRKTNKQTNKNNVYN